MCPSGLLRVVRSRAAFAAPAVLLLLVPQGFTTSDPARAALGTAAEAVGVESSPDTAVAEESTSPRIVGPWHAGLSWFTVARESCSNSTKPNRVGSAGDRGRAMNDWTEGEIRWIALEAIGEHYRRYRLPDTAAEAAMASSLGRYGQLSPLAVCLRQQRPEVLDGFKRVAASRTLPAVTSLQARLVVVDEPTAKAIILGLNGIGGRMKELEEAWIVQALVREDGLSQLQVADLLQRHKSWVCRRLALLERLSEACRQDLRLGLLSPTMARQLTRLPSGNQIEVVAAARREHLSAAEVHGVVDLVVACTGRPQVEFILHEPRRALRQAQIESLPAWDPRVSAAGNRVLRQLGGLLDGLGRMENWLRHKGRADLAPCDRGVLSPGFKRLTRDARSVAELTEDLLTEIDLP